MKHLNLPLIGLLYWTALFAASLLAHAAPARLAEEAKDSFSSSLASPLSPALGSRGPVQRLKLVGARWHKVLAGERFTVGLRKDGTVTAWGDNSLGQTNVPADLSGVVDIAVGRAHTLCLLGDGTMRAFGWNKYGQANVPKALSIPKSDPSYYLHSEGSPSTIGAGYAHSVAILGNGTLLAWGSNQQGQTNAPKINYGSIRGMGIGWFHNLVFLANNTVLCWGSNLYGQCKIPKFLQPQSSSGYSPPSVNRMTAGAYFNVVQIYNGSFFAFGKGFGGAKGTWYPYPPRLSPRGLSIVGLHAGLDHFLLDAEGPDGIFAYGGNTSGQTNVPSFLRYPMRRDTFSMSSAGAYHSVALMYDGSLFTWGCQGASVDSGQCASPDPCGVLNGGCSANATCSPLNGIANCTCKTGFVGDGKECYPPANSRFKQIDSFGYNSLAIMDDGTLRPWGVYEPAYYGPPVPSATILPKDIAKLRNITKVATGLGHSLALLGNGTVVGWGLGVEWSEDKGASQVPEFSERAIDIAAGRYFSAAILASGTLRVWGDSEAQTQLDRLANVARIAVGDYHVVVVFKTGVLKAFGWVNKHESPASPLRLTIPAGLTGSMIKQLSAAMDHNVALLNNGKLRIWGSNSSRQLMIPSDLGRVRQVSARGSRTVCLMESGDVVELPYEEYPDRAAPLRGSPGIASMSAGVYHRVLLMNDGSMRFYSINSWAPGSSDLPDPCKINSKGCSVNAMCGNVSSVAVCMCKAGFSGDGKVCTPNPGSKIVQILPSHEGLAVLKADGTAKLYTAYEVDVLQGLRGVKKLFHANGAVALMGDGSLRGLTAEVDLKMPANVKGVTKISGAVMSIANGTITYLKSNNGGWNQQTIPKGLKGSMIRDFDSYDWTYTVAALTNGSCVIWGQGLPENSTSGAAAVRGGCKQVSAGQSHVVVLLDNGKVAAFGGRNYAGQLDVPRGLSGVVQVLASEMCSFALLGTGKVVSWGGANWSTMCGNMTLFSNVKQIGGIYNRYFVALLADGTIRTHGYDAPPLPPNVGVNIPL